LSPSPTCHHVSKNSPIRRSPPHSRALCEGALSMVFNATVRSCFRPLLTVLRAVLSTTITLNVDVHDIPSSTMASPELYHFKRQFFPSSRFCLSSMISQPSSLLKHTLCAYKTLVGLICSHRNHHRITSPLLFTRPTHASPLKIPPQLPLLLNDFKDVTIKALVHYIAVTTSSTTSKNSEWAETALEELRDLSVETGGGDL